MLVGPRTGASERKSWLIARARDRVAFGWGMLDLARFVESGSWGGDLSGLRFSDDVSHILVGAHHGCCSRAVTRGLDRRVLDGVNALSLAGSGYGSFAAVRCTGFMNGGLPMGSMSG